MIQDLSSIISGLSLDAWCSTRHSPDPYLSMHFSLTVSSRVLDNWSQIQYAFYLIDRHTGSGISSFGYRPLGWLRSSHAGGLIKLFPTIIFPYWSQIRRTIYLITRHKPSDQGSVVVLRRRGWVFIVVTIDMLQSQFKELATWTIVVYTHSDQHLIPDPTASLFLLPVADPLGSRLLDQGSVLVDHIKI